jgi:2-(1,2-epoxy-1,2-dihydrophenyl)acetyl-CoA isomerase
VHDDGWQVEQHGRVRWLLLDRPARKNAMTSAMGTRLGELLDEAERDAGTRVLVITGVGDAFSAGLDRDEIASGLGDKSSFPVEAFYAFTKPTVACVNGLAYGGGATLTVACDLRVVGTSGSFTFGLAKLGLTPEWGSSYFLWRQIGWGRALDAFLTGRTIDAAEAHRLGLADRVVDDADLRAETQALAEQLASLPEGTAEATKAVLRRGLDAMFLEARDAERAGLADRVRALRARAKARAARSATGEHGATAGSDRSSPGRPAT